LVDPGWRSSIHHLTAVWPHFYADDGTGLRTSDAGSPSGWCGRDGALGERVCSLSLAFVLQVERDSGGPDSRAPPSSIPTERLCGPL
jgi:hypothetical protein